MAKKLYEEANIQAIADAIREKNGLTEAYRTADMAGAILAMDAGGSSADVIFPPTDSWEFSKVLESSDSYTIGDCRFTTDTFFGSYSGANKGVGLRSKEKIDLTGIDFLHIEFASSGIASGSQLSVYVQNTIDSGSGGVVDRVATADEISAGVMDVDVSAVNGSYYIVLGAISWYNKTVSLTISNIRLDTSIVSSAEFQSMVEEVL